MSSIIELNINSLKESYEFGKVAKQADGAVLYKSGKAVLLATVAVDKEAVAEDFLPLTVQYLERSYAAAKIPGGFIKRESKPSDFETLTARIIDRALRPLFPKGFANNVVITVLVLSSDSGIDLQVAALHAANAALLSSSLPINKSIAALRVAKIDEKVVYNPALDELNRSSLDLLLVGSNSDITMIEMRALSSKTKDGFSVNELKESELVEIIKDASLKIDEASKSYATTFAEFKKASSFKIATIAPKEEILEFISANYDDAVNSAISTMAKSERGDALDLVLADIIADIEQKELDFSNDDIKIAFAKSVKNRVREMLLSGKRLDGRDLNKVRDISIETNILPSVHGSTLFTRGETQALVTATLGDKKDAQMYELLTNATAQNENLMVHYNFPPFCVGEARAIGAPSRRELGHGNLAKRAIEPTIDLDANQTIRLVSEILESNGSSSMATVCGSSLSLYCVNANVKKLTAGVAMGVVVESNEKYSILTDIMGAEDHYGDMDLKVAGTRDGITAMQMDIKLEGLNLDILENALSAAKEAREHILDIMEEAKDNIVPSNALPSVVEFSVTQGDIPVIIGKGGSTIREIIAKYSVNIDINRDKGVVKVSGESIKDVEGAKDYITNLLENNTYNR
jgi:polyribonucleotide nucleotidyltransferase